MEPAEQPAAGWEGRAVPGLPPRISLLAEHKLQGSQAGQWAAPCLCVGGTSPSCLGGWGRGAGSCSLADNIPLRKAFSKAFPVHFPRSPSVRPAGLSSWGRREGGAWDKGATDHLYQPSPCFLSQQLSGGGCREPEPGPLGPARLQGRSTQVGMDGRGWKGSNTRGFRGPLPPSRVPLRHPGPPGPAPSPGRILGRDGFLGASGSSLASTDSCV